MGNTGRGIPYYAVFVPGQEQPHHSDGVFLSPSSMLDRIKTGIGNYDLHDFKNSEERLAKSDVKSKAERVGETSQAK